MSGRSRSASVIAGAVHRPDDRVGRGERERPRRRPRGAPSSSPAVRGHVGAVGQLGVLERAQHRRHGGQVDDGVNAAVERRGEHLGVGQISPWTTSTAGSGWGCRSITRTERARAGELGHHVATDEPGTPGDQDPASFRPCRVRCSRLGERAGRLVQLARGLAPANGRHDRGHVDAVLVALDHVEQLVDQRRRRAASASGRGSSSAVVGDVVVVVLGLDARVVDVLDRAPRPGTRGRSSRRSRAPTSSR